MKKTFYLLLTLTLLLLTLTACNHESASEPDVWDGTVASDFSGGNGTESKPYKISKASQLAFLAKSVNEGTNYSGKYLVLTNDIDLNSIEWTPIGNGINSFNGCFDGNGKTIKNLKITKRNTYMYEYPTGTEFAYCDVGLFATVQDVQIKNLSIDNAEISICSAETYVGVCDTRVGILCGAVRTYDSSSKISDIKIQNSKIITDFQTRPGIVTLRIGGAIGNIYSTETTTTDINRLETNIEISIEHDKAVDQDVGSIIGYSYILGTFNIENCVSHLDLNLSETHYYYTLAKNSFGTIGKSTASRHPFSVKNIFSKITIKKQFDDRPRDYPPAFVANVILGDAYYYAKEVYSDAVGYKFENVFGCVELIDENKEKSIFSTTLYELPLGPDFSQINCEGCESLPQNHGFDKKIWDLSDLSHPKLK